MVGDIPFPPIRLTAEQLRHIYLRHPEMAGMEWAIRETMENPESVLVSESDPARVRELYRWFPDTSQGNKYVRVVVGFEADDAFVITAHLTRRIPKRGA